MRVLEKGQFMYTFACDECNAILMTVENDFWPRDGHTTSTSGMTGGITEIVCECSECSTTHIADENKIPPDTRKHILDKNKFQPRARSLSPT